MDGCTVPPVRLHGYCSEGLRTPIVRARGRRRRRRLGCAVVAGVGASGGERDGAAQQNWTSRRAGAAVSCARCARGARHLAITLERGDAERHCRGGRSAAALRADDSRCSPTLDSPTGSVRCSHCRRRCRQSILAADSPWALQGVTKRRRTAPSSGWRRPTGSGGGGGARLGPPAGAERAWHTTMLARSGRTTRARCRGLSATRAVSSARSGSRGAASSSSATRMAPRVVAGGARRRRRATRASAGQGGEDAARARPHRRGRRRRSAPPPRACSCRRGYRHRRAAAAPRPARRR